MNIFVKNQTQWDRYQQSREITKIVQVSKLL